MHSCSESKSDPAMPEGHHEPREGVVIDHDVTVRDVTRSSVVPRRYQVETLTTRTDWHGDTRRYSSWHNKTQHDVVTTTLPEVVHVAICELSDGSRRSFVSDDIRLARGERVLFVRHHALGFRADDVLRLLDRRWMTEVRLPRAGNVPLLGALLIMMVGTIMGVPDLKAIAAGAATFASAHVIAEALWLGRRELVLRSRRKAGRTAAKLTRSPLAFG